MTLSSLVEDLKCFPGIQRKQAVGRVLKALGGAWDFGSTVIGPGDDAAVLKMDSQRSLLLAADSIMPLLVEKDPYRAGRAAVLVNANDIYAMGGRPLAMVNLLSGMDENQERSVCHGIREESRRLQVPMVGGHTSPEGATPFLAVSVLGEAKALLADRNARPDQVVLLAMDLRGETWGDHLLNWDSHVKKNPEDLQRDLAVLCTLAEEGLCVAAKDVSNAGVLGSLAMLLEHAGVGATVDLSRIKVPDPFSLSDWLKVYPSYGFLLICNQETKKESLNRFYERGIWASDIGRTSSSRKLNLCLDHEEAVLFDFSRQGVLNLP